MNMQYEALRVGDGRVARGEIEAATEREAIRLLEASGMVVTNISSKVESRRRWWRRDVSREEVALAFFELSTMLQSGVSVAEAIDSQSQAQYHPRLNQFFNSVSNSLRSGESLSNSIQRSGLDVPDYLIQLIKSGELSGELPACLRRGVEQMEYELDLLSQFKSALIYPAVLVLAGVIAVSLIFILVVPRFSHLLEQGTEMHWLAHAVLVSGLFFSDHYPFLLMAIGLGVVALIWLAKQSESKKFLLNRLAGLPVVGAWLIETEIARWASMMAALTGSRVELLTALKMSAVGVGIDGMRGSLERVAENVRQGEAMSAAMERQHVLTVTATNLMRVGEKTGKLAPMLEAVARLYDVKCKARMNTVLALIEPLSILLIGLVIGVLVLGIILAITSISTVEI